MTEATTDKVDAVKAEKVEIVDKVARKTANEAAAYGRRIVKRLEDMLGFDIDGDGKIGKIGHSRIAWLVVLLAVSFVAMATTFVQYQTYDSDAVHGTFKVTDDGAGTATLTVDAMTVSTLTTTTDEAAGDWIVGGNLTVATNVTVTGLTASLPVITSASKVLTSVTYAALRGLIGLEIGTDVQAYDADLTTYAGITPSADVQSILGAASDAALRGLVDLEIGTDLQAYDADLTTYAGITPSADVQGILGAATDAALRGLIDLEIGTDLQAQDSDLDTWGTITPSADAQGIVGAGSYAAMRGLLNLEIGTDIPAVGFTGTWTPGTNGSATLVDGVITTFVDGT